MIIEHALLTVPSDQRAAFETAMREARPLIAASPGFLGLEVRSPLEGGSSYLLLVRWESIAVHREGFRQSERYVEWRTLLHHFYHPMPELAYFGDSILV